jgi:hypothetical protein
MRTVGLWDLIAESQEVSINSLSTYTIINYYGIRENECMVLCGRCDYYPGRKIRHVYDRIRHKYGVVYDAVLR